MVTIALNSHRTERSSSPHQASHGASPFGACPHLGLNPRACGSSKPLRHSDRPTCDGRTTRYWGVGLPIVRRLGLRQLEALGLPAPEELSEVGLLAPRIVPRRSELDRALVAGLWTAAWLGQLAALGLQTSRAKLPWIPFDPSWDLRVVFILALAGLGLRVAVSALPRPTWKLAGLGPWALWFVLGAIAWTTTGTTLALERHVLDLADGIHLVVLGATALWTTTTALWLMASAGHAALVGARIAAQRSAAASGLVAVSGILTMAIATPLLANPELLQGADVYRDAPLLAAIKTDVHEAGNMLAANMAEQPPEPGSAAAFGAQGSSDPEGMFSSCMEQLVVSAAGQGPSIKDDVTRKLSGRYRSLAHEVDDLVEWKMIDVCSDERERSRDDLQAYLYSMAKKAAVSRIRKLGAEDRYWTTNRCLIDSRDDEITDFEEHQHRELTVARVLEDMPAAKRSLLTERYFDGLGFSEMAARRDMTTASVSRATSRAREAFRGQLASGCE